MEDILIDKATVFAPNIKRITCRNKNNLYDLLEIVPAQPVVPSVDITNTCDFNPRTDKFYVPKKKSRLKVKTVRDIRKAFEEDTYAYLPDELERQKSVLLKKIRRGSSREEDTKHLARNILKSEVPILRPTWQMLINLNPENYPHPEQFVIWNGKHIQVNGSKGGYAKYVSHYDLGRNKVPLKHNITFKKKFPHKKKGLLRNSLAIKFKPGPLGRKKVLDDSHQKYHLGDIEVVTLPNLGLDIYPTYGTPLEPTITNFLNNLRKEDGTISQKWAEFAVSVLGKMSNSDPVQIDKKYITFDLNYKCNQHRLLMRRDVNTDIPKVLKSTLVETDFTEDKVTVLPEVEAMMVKILDSIEISLNQDNMYNDNDNEVQQVTHDEIKEEQPHIKEKLKRKYCELDRLDVTVIRLPDKHGTETTKICDEPYCSFGCICDSLNSPLLLREHCGNVDCMFKCKCDFTKFHCFDVENSELTPDLLNLSQKIDSKLSKEEQKFHQTVILKGDKSILLRSQKRNTKTPKKYVDFYKNISYKSVTQRKQNVSVVLLKINSTNIEPWCMVHKLYRCFCKGKFIEASTPSIINTVIKEPPIPKDGIPNSCNSNEKITETSKDVTVAELPTSTEKNACFKSLISDLSESYTCSRVIAYSGRKYTDGYYKHTNNKILSMEQNDSKLQQRMMNIIHKNLPKDKICNDDNIQQCENVITQPSSSTSTNINQFLSGVDELIKSKDITSPDAAFTRSKSKRLPNKTKLVAWLESNYKMYKERIDHGVTKTSLDPPKLGKVALYPWDFILSRYSEAKNLFLISKQKPFRIFMAVNTKNPMFENCININDIRFADLHNYPVTVKNLLTNATDLKDNFCILCGLSDCWELIGSVSKVNDGQENDIIRKNSSETDFLNPFDVSPTWGDKSSFESRLNNKQSVEILVDDDEEPPGSVIYKQTAMELYKSDESSTSCLGETKSSYCEDSDNEETSKWFVMTIENDFSEIRFYKRGFFVKYESILNAINVARVSGKTVRLSSQKCMEKNNGPQFGMYAVPNSSEHSVFIGPYEIQDSLGIETIRSVLDVRKLKRTRGFWITTNKIDNLKVLDNPLSFMNCIRNTERISVDFHSESSNESKTEQQSNISNKIENISPSASKGPIKKIVKPIKIRKTNGFYHLDSNGLLKKNVSTPLVDNSKVRSLLINSHKNVNERVIGQLVKISNDAPLKIVPKGQQSPVISPIKITSVYSTAKDFEVVKSKHEKGMLVLKPEEINRKLFVNTFASTLSDTLSTTSAVDYGIAEEQNNGDDSDVEEVFQNLDSGCSTANEDTYVISDEEVVKNCSEDRAIVFKEVWIECSKENIGWIHGRKDLSNCLSFKIPGGDYTAFYPENETFNQINMSLAKEFDRPEVDLLWKVVESKDGLKGSEIHLADLKHILFSEQDLPQSDVKTYSRTRRKTDAPILEDSKWNSKTDSPSGSINHEDLPFRGSTANSSELINSIINAPDNLKQVMTETLKTILSMAQDPEDE